MAQNLTAVSGGFTRATVMPAFLPAWIPTRLGILLWKWFHHPNRPGLAETPSILVVRLDGIGDCVLTTPMITALKRRFPAARITIATRPIATDVFANNSEVDEIITVPMYRGRSRIRKGITPIFTALQVYWNTLRHRRFDIAISPRYGTDQDIATLLCALAAAPVTAGFADDASEERQRLNRGYEKLFTLRVPKQSGKHEAERNLAVASAITGFPVDKRITLNVPVSDENARRAEEWLRSNGISTNQPIIFIGLPAANLQRCWEPLRFAEVVRLFAPADSHVVVAADTENSASAQAIVGSVRPLHGVIALSVPLQQLRHIFERGTIYLGNDSGLAHLAAAANIPTLILSNHPITAPDDHARSPLNFAPWTDAVRTIRPGAPAGEECIDGCVIHQPHCINNITSEEVVKVASELVAATRIGRGKKR